MPTGILINGNNGSIQIDSNFSNLSLVSSGQIVPSDPQDVTPGAAASVITSAKTPFLFIGNTRGSYVTVLNYILPDGRNRYSFLSQTANSVDYYVYAQLEQPPAGSGFGLQVFKENGDVAFDSSMKPLIIRDIRSSTSGAFSKEAGATICICTTSVGVRQVQPQAAAEYGLGVRVSSTSVDFIDQILSRPGIPLSYIRANAPTYLIVAKGAS